MRKELIILFATAAYVADVYYDGKYTALFLSYKKYYQMVFYGIIGVSVYLLFTKSPIRGRKILCYATNMIKYLPIDSSAMSMVAPILDFTDSSASAINSPPAPIGASAVGGGGRVIHQTKRCVSETKKKFVAAAQNWMCAGCDHQLDHTFEIDHKLRLEYGGTNDEQNLVALCRNCHGKKTASENM